MALATSVLFPFPRVGFMFYFLPSIVAFARGKRDLLTDLPTQCFPQDINRLGCRFDLGSKGGRARQHVAPARKTAQFPPAIRLGSAGQRQQPRCQSQQENPRMLPLAPAPLPNRACDPDA
jgi:hypothetical protein